MSHSRWTALDSLLVVVVVSLFLRLGGPSDHGASWADTVPEPTRHALTNVLETPIPGPSLTVALGKPVRLDAAVRCLGLVMAREQMLCRLADGSACKLARDRSLEMERSLWMRNRDGYQPRAHQDRVSRYAEAYGALADRASMGDAARVGSMLQRDAAMCARYSRYFANMPGGILELAQE
ncbi:MAG: hypothetical protein AAGJ28_05975 [Pseudomonadota bacterium]